MLMIVGLENVPELTYAGEPLKKIVGLPLTENVVISNCSENPDSAFPASDFFGLSHSQHSRNERPKSLSTIAWSNDILHDDFFIKKRELGSFPNSGFRC
jgi:hypothetical protein